jgi:hypothetical protein
LTSSACTDYYLVLDLKAGAPCIINNNFPLQRHDDVFRVYLPLVVRD